MLESCAGIITKPCLLKWVPLDQFGSKDGVPFTLGPHTEGRYISLKYPKWAAEEASSIGVSQLSPQEFLQDLHALIAYDADAFHARSATWHSELAAALVKLGTDTSLIEMMLDMCIIPLQNGSWTSARGKSIFFSKVDSTLEIPSGIEVLVVDAAAKSDPNRRNLFGCLGAKAWEASEICRLVLSTHSSQSFKPEALATSQLVSHAVFLWKASWQPPKGTDLWFATSQNKRCQGRKVYIPGSTDTNSAAYRIFSLLQNDFAVIHGEYLEATSDRDWPDWLVRNLGLSRIPRLVSPQIEPMPQPAEAWRPRPEEPSGSRVGSIGPNFLREAPEYSPQKPVPRRKKKPKRRVVDLGIFDDGPRQPWLDIGGDGNFIEQKQPSPEKSILAKEIKGELISLATSAPTAEVDIEKAHWAGSPCGGRSPSTASSTCFR